MSGGADMMCQRCKRRLALRRDGHSGKHTWEHPYSSLGAQGHDPQPVPIDDTMVGVCDFCPAGDAVWVYTCATPTSHWHADRLEPKGREELRLVSARESAYRQVQPARITAQTTHVYDEAWAACEGCAQLIERRDINRLVTRVKNVSAQVLPPGRRAATRRHLYEQWQGFFATVAPGRTPARQGGQG